MIDNANFTTDEVDASVRYFLVALFFFFLVLVRSLVSVSYGF